MLDSFDVMLYAMVCAALINDPDAPSLVPDRRPPRIDHAARRRRRRHRLRRHRRSLRPQARADGARSCSIRSSRPRAASRRRWRSSAIFRVCLGLGMGGEWATGAALVSESFPAKHRGKALAFVQSSWAIGYGLAALVNLIVLPIWGWRGVFFVGVLPGALHAVDSPQRRGAADLARHAGGSRPHRPAVRAARRHGQRCS